MYCSKCGHALAPGARFCSKCGTVTSPVASVARVSLARPGLITALAVLQFVGAAFLLIAAFGVFASLNDKDAMGIGFGVFFLGFAILAIFTGIGLWGLKEWGRILQIIGSSIGLLALPLGTIISILILIYLTRPATKVLFAGKTLNQLTPDEVASLQGASSGGSGATVAVIAVVALVGVAFLGIMAAIAIPNLLTAMQRSKQKRTIAEMRTVAMKIEEYKASQNKLPEDFVSFEPKTHFDGWGTPIHYMSDGTNYWLISAGKDGRFEHEKPQEYAAGATTNFDADIVLQNGELLQAPEGVK